MEQNRKIVKVKLIDGENLLVSYITGDGKDKTKTTIESKKPVHADLKNAMAAMNIHFILLAGFIDAGELKQVNHAKREQVEPFRVSGYSIGGNDDDHGIVITGIKTLKNGKAITVNTPFTRFGEDDATGYKFIDGLLDTIEKIETEVAEFLDNGKMAPDPQLNMFTEHGESAPGTIENGVDAPGEPKKGKKGPQAAANGPNPAKKGKGKGKAQNEPEPVETAQID